MKICEAIEELKSDIALYDSDIVRLPTSVGTPDRNLIDALEMAIAALGKAQPAQPLDVQTPVVTWGICPSCNGLPMLLGRPRRIMQSENYCSNCGQRIDWGEENDD